MSFLRVKQESIILEIINFFNKILIDGIGSNPIQNIRYRVVQIPVLLGGGACWTAL